MVIILTIELIWWENKDVLGYAYLADCFVNLQGTSVVALIGVHDDKDIEIAVIVCGPTGNGSKDDYRLGIEPTNYDVYGFPERSYPNILKMTTVMYIMIPGRYLQSQMTYN